MSHSHDHPDTVDEAHAAGNAHGHDHDLRGADKNRVLLVALLTGGFMVIEALGGVLTGSLALLADAGHMLTDSIALWLAWWAFRLAERPATGRHTYGYGRVKTLVAYTNGVGIFVIALWIVYEAVTRFFSPGPVLGGPMLLVALAGLAVNIGGFLILRGGNRESLNMRGAILHVLGDLLGSVAAIVAALVILATGWTPIDPILSVLVAVLILSTAWSLMREAAHLLLEGAPANIDRDGIAADLAANVEGVKEINHMHVWSLDGEKTLATLNARLAEGANPIAAVTAIKSRLAAKHGIDHATVEPEFSTGAGGENEHRH
ncbi:cation diffusion facilitator family transporter [Mesorhizobium sp. IMUNJ 23232]|uniref:cation diffusion facilitator family transporter n=1 Tax=Mesorhizobium sp. IMUNJ 23232 TaxID=3376064 RepID=UPI00378D1EAF